MSGSSTRLARIDPLLAESRRTGRRVRLYLRDSSANERTVEGIVREIVDGKDGRPRIRLSIPTGSGEPVEVRVLLESVQTVETVAAESDAPRASAIPVMGSRTTLGIDEPIPAGRIANDDTGED